MQGAIGFGFASHWLKNLCEIFNQSFNRNRVVTFDSHLKTAQIKTDFYRIQGNILLM